MQRAHPVWLRDQCRYDGHSSPEGIHRSLSACITPHQALPLLAQGGGRGEVFFGGDPLPP